MDKQLITGEAAYGAQMAHAQRLREKVLNGEPLSTPTAARPPQGASMTRDEQLEFFTNTAGR